jgi:hypothetical protein
MRGLRFPARVLILVIAAATGAFAQSSALHWQVTESRDGKFSFEMPGQPNVKTQTLKAKNGSPVGYAAYTIDFGKSAYLVSTSDYDSGTRFSLDEAIDGVVSSWEKPRIVKRKRATFHGHPMQTIDLASGRYRVLVRAIAVGKRLYQLAFVEAIDEYVPAHSDRFMSSFRLR